MTHFAFYSLLLINWLTVFTSILLEKFNKKNWATIVFPITALLDVIFCFLVFANQKQELETMLFKLFFTKKLYLTYGFLIDQASSAYLLVLAIVCFCTFIFCYSFSIITTGKNFIFSVLSVQIFFLKIAILATGFFQFMFGMENALLLAGILIANGRGKEKTNNIFTNFITFEVLGSFFIFMVLAIWLSITNNDSFLFIKDRFLTESPESFLISLGLWLFIWSKGAFVIGNFVFVKASKAHFPGFVVTAVITLPLCWLIMITRLLEFLLLFDNLIMIFAILGIITVLLSALFAVFEKDLGYSLAFLLSSQVSLMITVFILNGFEEFIFITIFQIMASLLFFLSCGSLIEAFSNEYQITKMGGAKKLIPATYFMMIISGFFMIIPYIGVQFLSNLWFINHLLLGAGIVFTFAVSRIIFCSCHGPSRAEEAVLARVSEKSFLISSSIFIVATFLTVVFYYINDFYYFSPLRLLTVILTAAGAYYFYLAKPIKKEMAFSFAYEIDVFLFRIIILTILKIKKTLKIIINEQILKKTIENVINKILSLFQRINYQVSFTIIIDLLIITLLLTLLGAVLLI